MKTTFTRLDIPGIEIWAASVTHLGVKFRVNISRTHANMHPFVFEIVEGDGFYANITGKGFGPSVRETMRRSVTKCREIAVAHRKADSPLPVALVVTDIESGESSYTPW